jgi:hypothetical protein
MEGYKVFTLPHALIKEKVASASPQILATSGKTSYDVSYYVKGALAGGICCAISHGALW